MRTVLVTGLVAPETELVARCLAVLPDLDAVGALLLPEPGRESAVDHAAMTHAGLVGA